MQRVWDDRIAGDHPALAGHFPGNPVVPGVLILSRVMDGILHQVGAGRALSWPIVKFNAPLIPGETFAIVLEQRASDGFKFAVRQGTAVIASGTVLYADPTIPAVTP